MNNRLSLGDVEDLMLHGARKDIYRTIQEYNKPQADVIVKIPQANDEK